MTDSKHHEVVEYRIKKVEATVLVLFGILFVALGMVVSAIGLALDVVAISLAIVSWLFILLGAAFASKGFATTNRGYNRAFWKWCGEEYADPPVAEWRDSLDDRNAFPVDGESK